jgi:hypothetical protein
VSDAGFALLALLAATTLSVYKPRGTTPYGRRKQEQLLGSDRGMATRTPRWVYAFVIVALVLLFVVRYLTVGGHRGHIP